MKTGSCLCGGVRFELRGELDAIIACHRTQCRKQTGHFWASTHTANDDLHFVGDEPLRWFRSGARTKRGFCNRCGSTLFWRIDGTATTSVCALGLLVIIFVAIATSGRQRIKLFKPIDESDRIDDWLYLPETLYAFMLIIVISAGAGPYSLDALILGLMNKHAA